MALGEDWRFLRNPARFRSVNSRCLHGAQSVQILRPFIAGFLVLFTPVMAVAGGPKYVAGNSYFNPAVVGQPLHWAGGVVNYFVDQGPLNSQINNEQATAMVDAAAALWSAVPT